MGISNLLIQSMRKERGWSQEQLATISGLSERTIQRIEKNGECSLDSKMALASAFEVSPVELEDHTRSSGSRNLLAEEGIDWASTLGYLSILIAFPIIIFVLTNTHGIWEIACLLIVDGLTLVLSTASYGFEETVQFFANTFAPFRKRVERENYSAAILQAKQIYQTVYIISFVTSLVYLLVILIHAPDRLEQLNVTLVEAAIPVLYAILLAEFWIRPFKHKLEKRLADKLGMLK